MTQSKANTFVGVTLTIYEPGFQCARGWLEQMHDLWVTPFAGSPRYHYTGSTKSRPYSECDPFDCVKAIPGRWHWQDDVIFETWAVGFDFNDIPLGIGRSDLARQSPLGYEWDNYGRAETMQEYVDDLLDLADPLIFKLTELPLDYESQRYHYSVSFVTAWNYEVFLCNHPLEPDEWDSAITLLGRVDLAGASIQGFE